MTIAERIEHHAYRVLTDGHVHDLRAILWAHQTLGLPAHKGFPQLMREAGTPPSVTELRIARYTEGAL